MTEKLQQRLNDSPIARWGALILVSLTMFAAYMFIDVLSPLQTLLETDLGWSPDTYGTVAGSAYVLNVFIGFLIIAGIILDKMGVRFTGLLSTTIMIAGGLVKLYAVSEYFSNGGFGYSFLDSFLISIPPSAKLACVGYAIFGCGLEMAGITVSKAIVKWFRGKELALAMGIEMAIARLGVFVVFRVSPEIANSGDPAVVKPVAVALLFLCIGLISYIVYSVMDKKLETQIGSVEVAEEEQFKISDIGRLFTNKPFMIIALLCVCYYSAIFPFQKFATSMLENRLGISAGDAADLFSWFPIGAMILTPFLGAFLDYMGKAATMLIFGSILVCLCHLTFALVSLTLPIAYVSIVLLGISFSLVPASLWPSVPKLVDDRYLGSAYSVIFWIQNIGLMIFPMIVGWTLKISNPGVSEKIANGESVVYDYTIPMLCFASLGVFAFILSLILKSQDKKHNYGLEEPNVKA